MKLARKKREESSATMAPTLWAIAGFSLVFALAASASDPSWWSSRGAVHAPVVTTNSGVVTTNYAPNPYAVVTQGQLKQFTARAVDELNADLATNGGAGTNLNALVSNWAQDYLTNGYATNTANPTKPYKPSDFTAMNVGQLKTIAGMVYGRLSAVGYVELAPSWLHQSTNTDNVVANLGQLKQVFDFDLSLPGASGLTATPSGSGTIDLSWTLPSTNNAASWLIEQQNTNGTWNVITNLTNPDATNYLVTGLTNGTTYNFQVIGSGTNTVSLPGSASGTPSAIPASGLVLWLKPDAGLTSSGTNVTGWADQTSNHNDATPGSTPPTVVTNSLAGYSAVHFDGSGGNYLTVADNPSLEPNNYTIFAVAKEDSIGSSQFLLCRPYRSTGSFGGWTSPFASYAAMLDENSSTYLRSYVTTTGGSVDNNGANIYDSTQPHQYSWRYDGANQQAYYAGNTNSAASAATTGNIDYSGGSADLVIGLHSSTDLRGSASEPLDGDVYEILVYNRALTDIEMQQAGVYLADKYGVYNPNATWPLAYSSDVQAQIAANQWNRDQADAYTALVADPPIPLSGLSLWLRADLGVEQDGGGNVTAWSDQAGGHSVIQSGSARPTYVASDLNGKPALRFSGGQWLYGSSSFGTNLNQDMTIVMVGMTTQPESQTYSVYLGQNASAGANRALAYYQGDELFDGQFVSAFGVPAPAPGSFVVEAASLNSALTQATFYRDGVQTSVGSINGGSMVNLSSGLSIGAATGGFATWQGDIAEVLVYDHQLSSDELAQIGGYLGDKYDLYDPNATWPLAYSSDVQMEIARNQWNKTQADNYVAFQAANPDMLTNGLCLWLRADAGVSTSAGQVTAIADQTGNYNLTQTNTSNQPTLVTNALDGKPALQFNGNQFLSSSGSLAPGLNADMTVITVGIATNPDLQTYALYLGQNNGTTGINRAVGYSQREMFDTAGAACYGALIPSGGAPLLEVATLDSTLSNVTFYENGVQTSTGALSGVQNLSSGITMGAAPGGASGWQGEIFEELVYDHKLSSAELQEVGQYLAARYGLPFNGPAPTISPNGGNYTSTQSVTITSSISGTIHYTLDGTAPTASSPTYSSAISLANSALVQAAVFTSSGTQQSAVGSAQFYINDSGDTGLAEAPGGLTVTADSTGDLDLSWTLNGQQTYSQVMVLRSTNGGAYYAVAVLDPTATSFEDTTVTAGNSYSYKIGTLNQAGVATTSGSSSVDPSSAGSLTIEVTTPSGATALP